MNLGKKNGERKLFLSPISLTVAIYKRKAPEKAKRHNLMWLIRLRSCKITTADIKLKR